MTDYQSGVKTAPYPVEMVWSKLSDMNTLRTVQAAFGSEDSLRMLKERAAGQVDAAQLDKVASKIKEIEFDRDSVTIPADALGKIVLRIVDREENRTVKFEAENSPIPATLWIQTLPAQDGSKMKLTLRVELNFFIKQMVGSKLKDGIDNLAQVLSQLPYGAI